MARILLFLQGGAVSDGGGGVVLDILFVLGTLAFFVLSVAYARACDRL